MSFVRVSGHAFCPDCGSRELFESIESHDFEYGAGEAQVLLNATFPIITCSICAYEYTDARAERAKHESVCRYLGRLTPSEIRKIRAGAKLTRSALAELTGVGKASLQRWESGASVQNKSCDQLLYLLQFPENTRELQRRIKKDSEEGEKQESLVGDLNAGASTNSIARSEDRYAHSSDDRFSSIGLDDNLRASSDLFTQCFTTGPGVWFTNGTIA